MWSKMSVLLWTVYWLQSSPTQPLQIKKELHIPQTPFLSILPLHLPLSLFSCSLSFHLSFLYLISTWLHCVQLWWYWPLCLLFLYMESFSSLVMVKLAAIFFWVCTGSHTATLKYFCSPPEQWYPLQSWLEWKHTPVPAQLLCRSWKGRKLQGMETPSTWKSMSVYFGSGRCDWEVDQGLCTAGWGKVSGLRQLNASTTGQGLL